MKNKLFYVASAVGVLLVLSTLYAFKNTNESTSYQHMTIIGWKEDLHHVFISIDGKEYKDRKDLARERKGNWDMNPIINLVHQYESQGWELKSFNSDGMYHTFWLRKAR